MNTVKIQQLLCAAVCMSAASVSTFAQSSASGESLLLEELIVTARKREQNLQEVAVGVSLLSGKSMAQAQLRNAADLATLLPTLNVQSSPVPALHPPLLTFAVSGPRLSSPVWSPPWQPC